MSKRAFEPTDHTSAVIVAVPTRAMTMALVAMWMIVARHTVMFLRMRMIAWMFLRHGIPSG